MDSVVLNSGNQTQGIDVSFSKGEHQNLCTKQYIKILNMLVTFSGFATIMCISEIFNHFHAVRKNII